jgi:hypothetical protein
MCRRSTTSVPAPVRRSDYGETLRTTNHAMGAASAISICMLMAVQIIARLDDSLNWFLGRSSPRCARGGRWPSKTDLPLHLRFSFRMVRMTQSRDRSPQLLLGAYSYRQTDWQGWC